jgi:hypothetical protein
MELSHLNFNKLLITLIKYKLWQISTGRLNPDVDEDGDFDKQDIYELTWQLQRAVEIFAPAADQLVKLGELDKDERKGYVLTLVLKLLPGIDTDVVDAVIESWVATEKHKE